VPIHDTGYRRYEGPLAATWKRWLPIMRSDFGLAFRNKRMLALYAVCIAPAFMSLFVLYMMSSQGWRTAPAGIRGGPLPWLFDPMRIDFYLTPVLRTSFILVVLYTTAVGSGIVSRDKRANALELYLTRGISTWQYVVGKWGAVTALLVMQLLVPTLVVWLYAVLMSPGWDLLEQTAGFMPSVAVAILILCAFLGFLLTAVSATTSSSAFAGLLWVLLLSFFSIVGMALRRILGEDSWAMVSPWFAVRRVAEHVCSMDPMIHLPWESAAGSMAAFVVIGALLLRKNLKAVEVVG
jgi:ABC-type transport system involved in multi-copper enzyme maturation permease subunit